MTTDSTASAECDADLRLHAFADGSEAYLTCNLLLADHAGLNHHDPAHGTWWSACDLPEHGHLPAGMPVTVRLGETARMFATRDAGREIRERIEALPQGQPVLLDWTGVEVITAAFGDELYGKLAAGDPAREVRCAGMCDDVRETLRLVRERRGKVDRLAATACADAEGSRP